jgi:hypothetical protein
MPGKSSDTSQPFLKKKKEKKKKKERNKDRKKEEEEEKKKKLNLMKFIGQQRSTEFEAQI